MSTEDLFAALEREALDELWRHFPSDATQQGVHARDGELEDWSAGEREAFLSRLRDLQRRLAKLDATTLPPRRARDARLLASGLAMHEHDLTDLRLWEKSPGEYIQRACDSLFLLMLREHAPLPVRAAALASRLEALPGVCTQAMHNVVPGKVPPRWAKFAGDVADNARALLGDALPKLFESLEDLALAERGKRAAEKALWAVQNLGDWSRRVVVPRATGDFALGRAAWERKVRGDHFLDHDAETLASLGERLVAETRGRLEVLAEEIAPGRGARGVADDLAREHASASELVALYRAEMERSRAFTLERGLATFPDGEALTVLPTPEFAKLTSPYASYQAPAPYDREQRGFFFVTVPSENDHDALAGHNRFELVPTAVHEGYPGHHLQLSWANRHPSATRKQLWSPAYAEGWALYCEELFGEQGYYRDARERFAMVRGLLWRAARVVVDTGLHTGGLTFDSAVEYMVAHGLLDRPGAEAEVLRYTMVPAYQLCYQLGRLAIHELRGEVRRREGGRFDLRRFHDRLLATCTVPPALAAEEVLSELP